MHELYLFAVCLNTAEDARPDDFWIELYWAEDGDHAEEQAEDANDGCAIVCVAQVPADYTRKPPAFDASSIEADPMAAQRRGL